MRSKAYGLPYKGSKNRIAKWVIGNIPANEYLVDIFAGGCAITHCAMLSGKFKHVIANDIGDAPETFKEALDGHVDVSEFPLTRNDFKETTDTLGKLVYSYGNDQTSYIYDREKENVGMLAERILLGNTVRNRYIAYKAFINELKKLLSGGGDTDKHLRALEKATRLLPIERLNRIYDIGGANTVATLDCRKGDYRELKIPNNSTVYADPPYRGTTVNQYHVQFDYGAFEDWLENVDFPVFVSEYTCPRGCVEIARKETRSLADRSNSKAIEKIFVQERFYDSVAMGGGYNGD